jgi:hypothetical protein
MDALVFCFSNGPGFGSQKVVIDWMIIDGPKAGRPSATACSSHRGLSRIGLQSVAASMQLSPNLGARRSPPTAVPIDVSGDGTNNAGRDIALARDEALALGITINGLAILSETPLPWNPEHTNPAGGLTKYYRDNVIGGPGSFVIEAKDFSSFGQAIIKKLIAGNCRRRAATP